MIKLHILGFAVSYHSYIEVDGREQGEWGLVPKMAQGKDLPEELQHQIVEFLKTYDSEKRKLKNQK